ncbi:OprD family outer membrane porin [Pseudomonas sp. O230]|uniref:OprD family outer membrane porin n=1 Tax=Pseudomonas sp. O230 TaxID=3159450 RepID=UPI00387B1B93
MKNIFPLNMLAGAMVVLTPFSVVYANAQSESNGFVEDSHLNLISRNYYWHQTGDLGHQRDWTQGEMLDFTSGFTQGLVGLGADAFAYGAVKLDGQKGRTGSMIQPFDSQGEPSDSYSKAGASVKVRISNSTLKYGDLQPQVPVFAVGNYYLLNQTATGFMFDTTDVPGTSISAGHFTSGTGYISTAHDGELGLSYAGVNTRQVDYLGGVYAFGEHASVTLYGSRYEDLMDQYYTNLNYAMPLSDSNSLTFDFNLYRSLDSGSANAGDINVTAASISVAYATGAHTFTIAGQRNHGDQPQDYAGLGGRSPGVNAGAFSNGIFLANAAEISDFNAPNEQSLQLKYDLNMAEFGIPGMTLSAKHVRGDDIDGTKVDESSAYFGFYGKSEKEHETDVAAQYIVQAGPAKDLTAKLFQSWHSGDDSVGGHVMQTRLVLSYPLAIF